MNKFMTGRTQPNNIQTMFWKITPMMTYYFMVFLSTIRTGARTDDFIRFNSISNGSSSFAFFRKFLFIFCSIFYSFVRMIIFSVCRLKIIIQFVTKCFRFTLRRTSIFSSNCSASFRLRKGFTTFYASPILSIFSGFPVVKFFGGLLDFAGTACFQHNELLNNSSPFKGYGLLSRQFCLKGEHIIDFTIFAELPRQRNYTIKEANYG